MSYSLYRKSVGEQRGSTHAHSLHLKEAKKALIHKKWRDLRQLE